MILPTKHVDLAGSLLGCSAVAIECLKRHPLSIDGFRREVEAAYRVRSLRAPSADDLILSATFLFVLGVVYLDGQGRINLAAD